MKIVVDSQAKEAEGEIEDYEYQLPTNIPIKNVKGIALEYASVPKSIPLIIAGYNDTIDIKYVTRVGALYSLYTDSFTIAEGNYANGAALATALQAALIAAISANDAGAGVGVTVTYDTLNEAFTWTCPAVGDPATYRMEFPAQTTTPATHKWLGLIANKFTSNDISDNAGVSPSGGFITYTTGQVDMRGVPYVVLDVELGESVNRFTTDWNTHFGFVIPLDVEIGDTAIITTNSDFPQGEPNNFRSIARMRIRWRPHDPELYKVLPRFFRGAHHQLVFNAVQL